MLNWLNLFLIIELGWLPNSTMLMYDNQATEIYESQGSFYTDLYAEIQIADHIGIGGGIKTFILVQDGYTYFPHEADYNFKARIFTDNFEFGFRHYCIHPVVPYIRQYGKPELNWEGSYEELYLQVKGRIGVF